MKSLFAEKSYQGKNICPVMFSGQNILSCPVLRAKNSALSCPQGKVLKKIRPALRAGQGRAVRASGQPCPVTVSVL
jgi:hypothetical protein